MKKDKRKAAETEEGVKVPAGSDRIKSWPTKERPREKLLAEGAEKQTDADLLAIIVRVGRGTFKKGVAGQNAQSFARSLLSEFGGLKGLDRSRIPELLKAHGLSNAKVAQIKAAFELGKRVCTRKLTSVSFESSGAVAAHFRPRFIGKRRETVFAVFLNGQNQQLADEEITQGTPHGLKGNARDPKTARTGPANLPDGSCEGLLREFLGHALDKGLLRGSIRLDNSNTSKKRPPLLPSQPNG